MLFIVVLLLKKKKRKGLTLNLADLLSSLRQESQAKLKKEMIKDFEVMRVLLKLTTSYSKSKIL